MAMSWLVRIAIGLGLGLATTLGLALLLDGWAIPAAAGALLAVIGFLGSFFLWSADRAPTPEEPEGYEQVLFDGPNVGASASMALLMVALAFFARFDAPGAPDPSAYLAAREPLVADLQTLHDNFVQMRADHAAGLVSQEDFARQLASDRTLARELHEEAAALTAPPSHEADAKLLRVAAEQLSAAIESMDLCIGGIEARCETAAERLADHEEALAELVQAGPAPE